MKSVYSFLAILSLITIATHCGPSNDLALQGLSQQEILNRASARVLRSLDDTTNIKEIKRLYGALNDDFKEKLFQYIVESLSSENRVKVFKLLLSN